MAKIHVIGAGLSGLAAALRLSANGHDVTVYEATGHGGGRCRSYYDDLLGLEIDNGNHLLLSGNKAAMALLDEIGSRSTLLQGDRAVFPFVDFADGQRWTVRPNRGPLPWWILSPARRVPGSTLADYLAALRFRDPDRRATVASCLKSGRAGYRRFWEPLTVAVLNTRADEAAAHLLWPVLTETFGRGESACRPCIARDGLSKTFIDPAIDTIERRGTTLNFNARLRALTIDGNRIAELLFARKAIALGPHDNVIVAVPAAVAAALIPDLVTPIESRPIANAHFRLDRAVVPTHGLPFLGIIGGTAEWLFIRGNVVSVTVSAATHVIDLDADQLGHRLWHDVARALDLDPADLPPFRVVKEKRATFAQTPTEVARRPGPVTRFENLVLAGDWTDTGLPATIEGSIRSGNAAVRILSERFARNS